MIRNFIKNHSGLSHTLLALLLSVIFAAIAQGASNRETISVSLKDYAVSDVTYADGTTAHSDSAYFGIVNDGDRVVVRVALPSELEVPDSALCFAIYHSITEVWWKDRLLASYGADIDQAGDMVGNAHIFAPIPDEAWGTELTIRLEATENHAFTRINTLKVYPKIKATNYFIDADPIGFHVSVPLVFFATAFILLIPCLSIHNRKSLRNLCLEVLA